MQFFCHFFDGVVKSSIPSNASVTELNKRLKKKYRSTSHNDTINTVEICVHVRKLRSVRALPVP